MQKIFHGPIMRHSPGHCKALSLVLIVALFTMRLSLLSEEFFVIPAEDAIFHNAFIAAEEQQQTTKTLKQSAKRTCELFLTNAEEIAAPIMPQKRPLIPRVRCLILRDISAEIFIPPEIIS